VPLTPLPARPKRVQTCAGRAYNVRAPRLVSPATLTQKPKPKRLQIPVTQFSSLQMCFVHGKDALLSSPSERPPFMAFSVICVIECAAYPILEACVGFH
jgi:hypothetical protein